MQADESFEFGLTIGGAFVVTEDVVQEEGNRVGDGKLEVHQGQHERRRFGADGEPVSDTYRLRDYFSKP